MKDGGNQHAGRCVQVGMHEFSFARFAVVVVVMALFVVGCSRDSGDSVEVVEVGAAQQSTAAQGTEPVVAEELPFGVQRCDRDASFLQADPSFYRDTPIYVANEQPTDEVRAWALGQPGYEDIWIDRDNNGWIAVGFSQDAAVRQSELEAAFPDAGVVAVQVPVTQAELQALRADVEATLDGLQSWGSSHSVPLGLVEISVPVLDEETLARFAPFAGMPLCVDGRDPADAVVDRAQPSEGDGWRLLGADRSGETYRTGVATNLQQYEALWAQAGLGGELPQVDFENEIVIWLGAVFGSGCPIRLDDMVFDADRALVHGDFVLPGNPVGCNDDDNPEAYVVAVDRDELPAAPFAVQLNQDDPPRGAPLERTTVTVDLRTPGSVAGDQERSNEAPPPEQQRFMPDMVIEDGFVWTLAIDLDCSIDIIGPLNGISWIATDPALRDADAPQAWEEAAIDRFVTADFLLSVDPPSLTITANGVTIEYEPVPADQDGDMSCS